MKPRIPGLGGWDDDPLWGYVYDWSVEHPAVGGLLWKLGIGSDLHKLYDAAAEIGEQQPGAAILDVPCGGGVALRGLKAGQGVRYVAADISQLMLDRTMEAAASRGVAAQVEPRITDVHQMEFPDGEFDLVVSFTGLHCFPDPHQAVLEMGRVTKSGGVLTGSAVLKGVGLRSFQLYSVGRAAGLMGMGATPAEVRAWMDEAGFVECSVEMSGAIGYFRGIKG